MTVKADLVLTGGTVVTHRAAFLGGIAVKDGKVLELFEGGGADIPADEVVDISGKVLLPGLIDAHVHFSEQREGVPWEGYPAGSKAAAAGGVTTILDMPVNEVPPTSNAALLAAKRDFVKDRSIVDYGHWGLLLSDNIDALEGLQASGVVAFKAFMVKTDSSGFRSPDTFELYQTMQRLAGLGDLLVGVHAEDDVLISGITASLLQAGRKDPCALIDARPPLNEVIAIDRAARLAAATGIRLHVLHVSCPEGIDAVQEAKQRGARITAETCPHYLSLTDQDLQRLGPTAASKPPVRSAEVVEQLWERVLAEEVDTIASDHCPCPPAMREAGRDDIWKAWTGATTLQTMLPVLLTEGVHRRDLSLSTLVKLSSFNPAHIFGLYPQKGCLSEGADADLVVVDLNREWVFTEDDIQSYYKLNPFIGRRFKGSVEETYVRGKRIYSHGEITAELGHGKLVKPVAP
jgi:allantoinase